jgi:hypothetical protein
LLTSAAGSAQFEIGAATMAIRLAVVDIGETLVDESRMCGEWADWLGMTRLTFFAAPGAVFAAKQHHHQVFGLVRAGIDLLREREARRSHGALACIERHDLYTDAVPTLTRLRAAGLLVGLAGNPPTEAEAEIRALGLSVDLSRHLLAGVSKSRTRHSFAALS